MHLWITADDYGLAAGVNAGVESLAAAGALTAVSVMVHRSADLSTLDRLRRLRVAMGLHLVLVEEPPLLPRHKLAPLLDVHGRLPRSYGALFRKVMLRPQLARLLREEAEAQMDRYVGLGLPVDVINSHQHVHLFPPIWRALRPLFRRYLHARLRLGGHGAAGWSKQGLLDLSSRIAVRLAPLPESTTLQPLGVSHSGHMTTERVASLLDVWMRRSAVMAGSRGHETAELVMHPALEDAHLTQRYSTWRFQWQQEYDLLSSGELHTLLRNRSMSMERWQ